MYTLPPKINLVVHSPGLGNDPGPTNAKHGMAKPVLDYKKCGQMVVANPQPFSRSKGCLHHGRQSCTKALQICDWLLNSSQDHFGLHQGKNVRVTMEFKVPKRQI